MIVFGVLELLWSEFSYWEFECLLSLVLLLFYAD